MKLLSLACLLGLHGLLKAENLADLAPGSDGELTAEGRELDYEAELMALDNYAQYLKQKRY